MSTDREEARLRVLLLLAETPRISQRDLARATGVSLGAVNYCLNALIEKGQVKARNFRAADNKVRYAYILTPRGLTEKTRLARLFLGRKLDEYEALRTEIKAIESELGAGSGTTNAAERAET